MLPPQSTSYRQGVQQLILKLLRLPMATKVALAGVIGCIIFAGLWFFYAEPLTCFLNQIQIWQDYPHWSVQIPTENPKALLAPTVVLGAIAIITTRLSPQPQLWSRVIIISIVLALILRYIAWRSLTTLDFSTPAHGLLSLSLLGLELLVMTGTLIQLFLLIQAQDRKPEADCMQRAVLAGIYQPTVDILIPTYNEPAFILRRTIIGCQALDYNAKQIYLLDDTRRSEIKQLAVELGCHYITRPDNLHAKAGNLNHAIPLTHSELIVVFDADFIPTTNFLTRTVGFFQDSNIALVQTPQSFYNPDPIAKNLGLEKFLTPEEEVFYRQIQPFRDGAGSVTCSGTSFVVRRSALESVGGFVTESLTEDYFTGIRLNAQGYRSVYLNEKLSAGLAADDISAHITQRLRWARGTLQAFFIRANPLTLPGLTLRQKLAHLEGFIYWISSLPRISFLLIPLVLSLVGIMPLRTTGLELLYFFLPVYLIQLLVFSWLNSHSRSALLSDIYSLVATFPLALTVISVFLNPFSQGFKVTPKGSSRSQFRVNWGLAIPFVILLGLTALSLGKNLNLLIHPTANSEGLGIVVFWTAYNLIVTVITLFILIDIPQTEPYEWYDLEEKVKLKISGSTAGYLVGLTDQISEGGMVLRLSNFNLQGLDCDREVFLHLTSADIFLKGRVCKIEFTPQFPCVYIQFVGLNLSRERQLIEFLYCRPNRWEIRQTPNELKSLFLLLKILFRPRIIFDRHLTKPVLTPAHNRPSLCTPKTR